MNKQTERTINELFSMVKAGATPFELSQLFSSNVDFYIAGDTEHVPWIGKKNDKKEVASFYTQLAEFVESIQFEIEDILVKGKRAVVLGHLISRVKKTGKVIKSEFAFDLTVDDQKITRFRLFEDSFAVSEAAK